MTGAPLLRTRQIKELNEPELWAIYRGWRTLKTIIGGMNAANQGQQV